jgi:hypothetical protein
VQWYGLCRVSQRHEDTLTPNFLTVARTMRIDGSSASWSTVVTKNGTYLVMIGADSLAMFRS